MVIRIPPDARRAWAALRAVLRFIDRRSWPHGEFAVTLVSPGTRGPAVILILTQLFGMRPGPARDLVNSCPAIVRDGITAKDAEGIKALLEYAGATVTISVRSTIPAQTTDAPGPAAAATPEQPASGQTPAGSDDGLFPASPWKIDPGDFDVVLVSPGPMADRVTRWIAAAFGIPMEEAAMLTARRLSPIKTGISGADAVQIEAALDRFGANADVVRRQHPPAQPSPPQQAYAKPSAPHARPVSAPKPTLFDAVLTDPGKDKIATRRALKNLLGLDLVAAYNAVEQVPSILKAGVAQAEAERLKAALAAVGATVEFRPSVETAGQTES